MVFASCSSSPDPQVNTPDASVDDVDPADLGTDAASSADVGANDASMTPLIGEAGLCDIPDDPRLTVAAGTDLMKVTLSSDDAVCNDGSPAIVYVRPAPAQSANADRWIVWFEGGGACNSAAQCAERWCGENPLHTAGKMSSTFAPDGIRGNGIFGSRPENAFADWNHVVGYYCSSDNWNGRQLQTAVDESGTVGPYQLYLHGAYIVDDLFATLKSGATSDDASVTMPSIDDASLVMLAGTSAGGGGARFNADRVADMLRETNADVDFRLVVDAGTFPSEPHPPELAEEDALALLDLKHDTITNWRDGVTDESCLAYHADDPRWCADNSHVLFHHVTTPWFVKMDLTDNANSPGPYADVQTFARVTFDLYAMILAGGFAPEESDVPIDEVGLFIPNCGHHVNLEVPAFFGIQISNGTDSLSTHDVLSNWIAGVQPTRALHDPDSNFTSICP